MKQQHFNMVILVNDISMNNIHYPLIFFVVLLIIGIIELGIHKAR